MSNLLNEKKISLLVNGVASHPVRYMDVLPLIPEEQKGEFHDQLGKAMIMCLDSANAFKILELFRMWLSEKKYSKLVYDIVYAQPGYLPYIFTYRSLYPFLMPIIKRIAEKAEQRALAKNTYPHVFAPYVEYVRSIDDSDLVEEVLTFMVTFEPTLFGQITEKDVPSIPLEKLIEDARTAVKQQPHYFSKVDSRVHNDDLFLKELQRNPSFPDFELLGSSVTFAGLSRSILDALEEEDIVNIPYREEWEGTELSELLKMELLRGTPIHPMWVVSYFIPKNILTGLEKVSYLKNFGLKRNNELSFIFNTLSIEDKVEVINHFYNLGGFRYEQATFSVSDITSIEQEKNLNDNRETLYRILSLSDRHTRSVKMLSWSRGAHAGEKEAYTCLFNVLKQDGSFLEFVPADIRLPDFDIVALNNTELAIPFIIFWELTPVQELLLKGYTTDDNALRIINQRFS